MKKLLRQVVRLATTLGLFGLISYGVYWFWYRMGPYPMTAYPNDLTQAGLYGDSYGYINSLFSALALAGVIVAVILQTFELGLQRQEIDESQRIMEKTAEAQRESQESLKQTAEIQRRTLKTMEEHAKLLFLSAYLTSLESQRLAGESLADHPSDLLRRCEGVVIVERTRAKLNAIVNATEPLINTTFDLGDAEYGSSLWARERLLKLTSTLNTIAGAAFEVSADANDSVRSEITKIGDQIRTIAAELNRYELLGTELRKWLDRLDQAVRPEQSHALWQEMLKRNRELIWILGLELGTIPMDEKSIVLPE